MPSVKIDYSTLPEEEVRAYYDKALKLRDASRSRLQDISVRREKIGHLDQYDNKSWNLASNGVATAENMISDILELYPDIDAPPAEPEKTGTLGAIGANMVKGFVESPYNLATSPISMLDMTWDYLPQNQINKLLYQGVTGKPYNDPTSKAISKANEYVEKGREKIYGKEGLGVIPWAKQKSEEAELGPIGQVGSEMAGDVLGFIGLNKIAKGIGALRKGPETPPIPPGVDPGVGPVTPGAKTIRPDEVPGVALPASGRPAPSAGAGTDPVESLMEGLTKQQRDVVRQEATKQGLPGQQDIFTPKPDISNVIGPVQKKGIDIQDPAVGNVELPWKPIAPEPAPLPKGVEPITPLKPQDVEIPVPKTVDDQVSQELSSKLVGMTEPVQQASSPMIASMQDNILRELELAAMKGRPTDRNAIMDRLAGYDDYAMMQASEFKAMYAEAVDGLKKANRLGKIAPSASEVTVIDSNVLTNLITKIEAHPNMQGIRVRNIGNNKLQLRDSLTGDIVRELDLNDKQTLKALMDITADIDLGAGGTTLASGFGALDEPTKNLFKKAGSAFRNTVKNLELHNPETSSSFWRMMTENIESPLFFFRKSKAGAPVVQKALESKASAIEIGRSALYDYSRETGLTKTKFFTFDDMDDVLRRPVERVLIEGDAKGKVYSPTELYEKGLTDPAQHEAYYGARELFDKIRDRIIKTNKYLQANGVRPIGKDGLEDASETATEEFTSKFGSRVGYIPRKWLGDWEIKITDPVTGAKSKWLNPVDDLDPEFGISSFKNKYSANAQANALAKDPRYIGKTITVEQFDKTLGMTAHGLERKGAYGYETDNIREVIHEYIGTAAKWEANAHFRVELKKVLEANKDINPDELGRIRNYARRFLGEKGAIDVGTDYILNKLPGLKNIIKTSDPSGQVFGGLRSFVTHTTLGMGNAAYAMVNLTGLINHVYPSLSRYAYNMGKATGNVVDPSWLVTNGLKTYFKGMKHRAGGIKSPESDLMEELVHKGVVDIQFWTESQPVKAAVIAGSKKLGGAAEYLKEGSLMLGRTTEEMSRVVSAVAGYKLAMRAGQNHEAAMKFATKFVAETMADFSKAGKPGVYTSNIGGTVGQFKTYAQTMIEQMYSNSFEGNWKSAVKYWGTTIGLGGYYGLPEAKSLDDAFTRTFGYSPLEEVTKQMKGIGADAILPTGAMTGVLGIDLSGRTGIGDVIPGTSLTDYVTWNKVVEPITELFATGSPKDALRALSLSTPGLKYYLNTDDQGNYLDRKGRIVYRMSEADKVKEIIGFMPQTRADAYRHSGTSYNKDKYDYNKDEKIKEKLRRKEITTEEALKAGLSSEQIANVQKDKHKTKQDRTIENSSLKRRPELKRSPFYHQELIGRPRPSR